MCKIFNLHFIEENVKKDARSLKTLKQLEEKCVACPLLDLDNNSAVVVKVFREVNNVAISIFRALLSFLSTPVSKPKVGKWHLVSKLMHKGVVGCDSQEEILNEVESFDVALLALSRCNSSKDVEVQSSQMAQNRLKDLKVSPIESLEKGLDFLFMRLTETRVSLLNIPIH
uniref:Uncharacterized protein n=1 Tax=Nelumbo nucifera TaxID=4432 RepID=A0A822ZSW3_NELNU|nr:TPA_asm: hypothetical protein HUJ06_004236 [Nelumbo nucifera]